MKTTVTVFKESGKWYTTFDVELPDHLQVWDKVEINRWLSNNISQCKNHNFTFTIDDVPHLVIHS